MATQLLVGVPESPPHSLQHTRAALGRSCLCPLGGGLPRGTPRPGAHLGSAGCLEVSGHRPCSQRSEPLGPAQKPRNVAEERGQGSADLTVGPAVPGQPAGCWPLPPWPGMSLLGSYEGLRQEIQRLAQENEELRRLVQLIQENQELKQVLRARGGSLGFGGAALLAEVTSSPRLPRRRTIKFKNADRGEPVGWPGRYPEACQASLTQRVPRQGKDVPWMDAEHSKGRGVEVGALSAGAAGRPR